MATSNQQKPVTKSAPVPRAGSGQLLAVPACAPTDVCTPDGFSTQGVVLVRRHDMFGPGSHIATSYDFVVNKASNKVAGMYYGEFKVLPMDPGAARELVEDEYNAKIDGGWRWDRIIKTADDLPVYMLHTEY